MKKCSKCGVEKLETCFSKQSRSKAGLNPWCKACSSEYSKKWQRDNSERQKNYYEVNKKSKAEKHRIWREINKTKIAEQSKIHYEANREVYIARSKKQREDNPEYFLEYNRKWHEDNPEYNSKHYETHKDEKTEKNKQWRKNNPNKAIVITQRRRTRKRQLPSALTAEQWITCKSYFDHKCAYCGAKKKLTIEHFIPVSNFGELSVNNVLPVCSSCNSSKINKDFFSWYHLQSFYSKPREQKILKFLNYKNGIQQLALL